MWFFCLPSFTIPVVFLSPLLSLIVRVPVEIVVHYNVWLYFLRNDGPQNTIRPVFFILQLMVNWVDLNSIRSILCYVPLCYSLASYRVWTPYFWVLSIVVSTIIHMLGRGACRFYYMERISPVRVYKNVVVLVTFHDFHTFYHSVLYRSVCLVRCLVYLSN